MTGCSCLLDASLEESGRVCVQVLENNDDQRLDPDSSYVGAGVLHLKRTIESASFVEEWENDLCGLVDMRRCPLKEKNSSCVSVPQLYQSNENENGRLMTRVNKRMSGKRSR